MAGFYLLRRAGKQHLDSKVPAKRRGMSRGVRRCPSLGALEGPYTSLPYTWAEHEQNIYSVYTEPFLVDFLL